MGTGKHRFFFVCGLFAGLFAINAWFRVFVVATYLSICLTPKTLHTTVSHQNIIANCDVIHLNRQPPVLFLRIWNFVYIFRIVYVCVRIRNGGHCVSRRHICRSYNLQPHQQRCAYTISPPHITPIIIYPFIFTTNACAIRNGGSHPAAHFCVRKICIINNNVVFIKYLHKKTTFTFIKLYCFYNCICMCTHP